MGKTTVVKALQKWLQADGYTMESYVESDFTNPIDFYCTAYFPNERYQNLCQNHPEQIAQIKRYSIPAGEVTLVRYFDGDTPLFSGSLLGELRDMKFCYHPTHLVSLDDYSGVYQAVWENFDKLVDGSVEYYIFDGSLLHHPLNDMIRNYSVSMEQAAVHVEMLLKCLKKTFASVFYLFAEDVAGQLLLARQNRWQASPDNTAVSFWKKRRKYDDYVLNRSVPTYHMMNVSQWGYEIIFEKVISTIQE